MAIDHRTITVGQVLNYKPLDLGFGDCGTESYRVLALPQRRHGGWWCWAQRTFTGYREWIPLDSCYENPILGPDDGDPPWP